MSEFHLCLSDLLDQDLTSFEYFQTLSKEIRDKLMTFDIRSFRELQETVSRLEKHQ